MFDAIPALLVSHPPLYLDPGTGSVVLQAVIAAAMSALFVAGIFRKRLAAFFGKLFGRKAGESADAEADDD